MPSYSYDNTVPAASHNPSTDQPVMLTNAQSIQSIWAEDHYTFSSNTSGQHQFVRFPANFTPSGGTIPTGLQGISYTQPGTADNTTSQLYFQKGGPLSLPLSSVRAAAMFNGTGSSPISISNGFNVQSVTRPSPTPGLGSYIVTLTTGAVSGTNFIVLISTSGSNSSQLNCDYSITSAGVFNILTFKWPYEQQNANSVSFVVLQI